MQISENGHLSTVPLKWITGVVVVFHAVLLICLLWLAPVTMIPVKTKQLKVQTVQLQSKPRNTFKEIAQAEVKKTTQSPPPAPKKLPEPVSKETSKPKPEVKPNPTPKVTPKPAPKPAPKKNSQPVPKQTPQKTAPPTPKNTPEPPKKNVPSKATLDNIRAKLASIPSAAMIAGKNDPGACAASDIPFAYEEELVARLKILLKLPEVGDVKVALTLNRQGKVVTTEILSSANPTNRKAIETQLPSIQFPPFGQAFVGENTHKFTITLTNL